MKILVINPILYTSETREIRRADSIKDTMIYDFCVAFQELGHEVVLAAAEPFRPQREEEYPFEVLWWPCYLSRIFLPHCLPFMPQTRGYIKKHREEFDLIVSSEVFSVNTLAAFRNAPDKVIVWHELAKHNAIMKQIPSHIWYGIIARIWMKNARIVARSEQAKQFIKQYCKNVHGTVIDHGVNLKKFCSGEAKSNHFVVCSQLIGRKRVDGILDRFSSYLQRYDSECQLYIIGDGEEMFPLKERAEALGISEKVLFMGRLSHREMLPILSGAMALLVNTEKDNNMVSIVEAIATGTPIVTTDVPLNATYIREHELGIAKPNWTEDDLREVMLHNERYVQNCLSYRYSLSTKKRVEQFLEMSKTVW